MAIPPFQAQQQQLLALLASDRPHHALLITGAAGIGKRASAQALMAGLLCEAPTGQRVERAEVACGQCDSCRWLQQGSHPDAQIIERLPLPGKEARLASDIGIDQIRALDDFTRMTGFRGRGRVVLIDPAEQLSDAAANALLKVLEEPGGHTWFLLVTHRPERLPATVRSRTRCLPITPPLADEAIAWLCTVSDCDPAQAATALALAGGAPLQARELIEPVAMAAHRDLVSALASIPDTSLTAVVDRIASCRLDHTALLLQRWVLDLLRVSQGGGARFFPDHVDRLRELAARCDSWQLSEAAERLRQQSGLIGHPLNPRLFLESLLALYRDAYTS